MQTYIDIVNKERAAYLEHNFLHLENVTNITIHDDSITLHKKNGREED